jgi:hypothetical protein
MIKIKGFYRDEYIIECSSCKRNFLDKNKEEFCWDCKHYEWWNSLSNKEKMDEKVVREWVVSMNTRRY